MIQFTNVFMTYPSGNKALQNINLNIDKGEMAYISGRSGAGKSTLLKLINLIDRHTRGQIIVKGQNLERIKNNRIPIFRRNIGFIFQNHRLLNDRTIFDNVALPLVISGSSHQEVKRRVQAALDKVDLLSKINNCPMELSGGEQQRVGVARAVVHRPAVLLADEPTGNLDTTTSKSVMELLVNLNREKGITFVIVTHEEEIARQCTRLVTIQDGLITSDERLVEIGNSEEE